MNVEELLADTFTAHEHLAPDPAPLLRELPNRRRRRVRARMAVGGAVVSVAAIAAGATMAAQADHTHHNRPTTATATGPNASFTFIGPTAPGTVIPQADRHGAGDFSGALLSGGTYSLSKQRGNVVVVSFWASWCSPCRIQTPAFDTIYRQYETKSVNFVGIDTRDESPPAKAFIADIGISYPVIFDQQGETAETIGKIPSAALPFTVLIDQQGRVAAVYMSAVAPPDLTRAVTGLLAEK